jgi:nucleotide-binding universal stress UspA family protein
MLDRILVPLDGSGLGELALVYAKELAPGFDSEIHLVSVSEGRAAEYRRMIQVYIERTADELRRDMGKDKAVVKTAILDGNPADRILEYAGQQKASLIITVSHGHSGILPWTMGSTAYRIVHGALVSVLLVRASKNKKKGGPIGVFSRVLLPLDGSATSEQAVPYGLELAKKLKSQLTLLSVVEPGQRVHTIGGQDYIQFSEQYVSAMKEELAAYLDRTVKNFEKNNVKVCSELRTGNAAEEIIKLSKAGKMKLVIMTSHGKSGLRQWVFGSVSNKVLHTGKTPLLLLR